MHTGPYKLLRDFAQKHPNTRSALNHWYELISGRNCRSIAELREVFPHADRIKRWNSFLCLLKNMTMHTIQSWPRVFRTIEPNTPPIR